MSKTFQAISKRQQILLFKYFPLRRKLLVLLLSGEKNRARVGLCT